MAIPGQAGPNPPEDKYERTAVIAIHGIGQQLSFDTIDGITSALCRGDEKIEVETQMKEVVEGTDDVLPRVRLTFRSREKGKEQEYETEGLKRVDIYEVYWAPLTEGRITFKEVVTFLASTAFRGFITTRDHEFDRYLFGKREYFPPPRALGWQLASVLLLLGSLLVIALVTLGVVVSLNPFTRASDQFYSTLLPHLTNDLLPLILFAFASGAVAILYGGLLKPILNSQYLKQRAPKLVLTAHKWVARGVLIVAWLIVLCCLTVAMAFVWHVLGNSIEGLRDTATDYRMYWVVGTGVVSTIVALLLARVGRSRVRAAAQEKPNEPPKRLGFLTKLLLTFQGLFTLAAAASFVGAGATCTMAFVWDGWTSEGHEGRILPGPGLFMQLGRQPERLADVPIFKSDIEFIDYFLDNYKHPKWTKENDPTEHANRSLSAFAISATSDYSAWRRAHDLLSTADNREGGASARVAEAKALGDLKLSFYPWPVISPDASTYQAILNLDTVYREWGKDTPIEPLSSKRYGVTAYDLFLLRRLIGFKFDVEMDAVRKDKSLSPPDRDRQLRKIAEARDLARERFDQSHGVLGSLSRIEDERYNWEYKKRGSPWRLLYDKPGALELVRGLAWFSVIVLILVLNRVLVGYVGDVVGYLSASSLSRFSNLRDRIRQQACKVGEYVYATPGGRPRYANIVVVGHSLGSLIGYDMLNSLLAREERALQNQEEHEGRLQSAGQAVPKHPPLKSVAERTKCFITFGSPLDKTAFIFRAEASESSNMREALAAELQPMIRSYKFRPRHWVNIYSRSDVLSSPLLTYDATTARALANPELDLTKEGYERLWEPVPKLQTLLRRKGVSMVALEQSLSEKGLDMSALEELLKKKKLNILALEALLTKERLDVSDLQALPDARDLNWMIFSRVVENVEDVEADWPFFAHTKYWKTTLLHEVLHDEIFNARWTPKGAYERQLVLDPSTDAAPDSELVRRES